MGRFASLLEPEQKNRFSRLTEQLPENKTRFSELAKQVEPEYEGTPLSFFDKPLSLGEEAKHGLARGGMNWIAGLADFMAQTTPESYPEGYQPMIPSPGGIIQAPMPKVKPQEYAAGAQQIRKEAAEKYPTEVTGLKDVSSWKDALRYVVARGGENVVPMASIMAGGPAAAVQSGIGEVGGNIYDATGEIRPGTAIGFGTLVGVFDSVIPARIAGKLGITKKMTGELSERIIKQGLAKGILKESGKQFILEGSTEGLQELIGLEAVHWVDENQKRFTPENLWRIADAFAAGGILGGATGGVTGAGSYMAENSKIEDVIPKTAQDAPGTTILPEKPSGPIADQIIAQKAAEIIKTTPRGQSVVPDLKNPYAVALTPQDMEQNKNIAYHGTSIENIFNILSEGEIKPKVSKADKLKEKVVSLSKFKKIADDMGHIILEVEDKGYRPRRAMQGDYVEGAEVVSDNPIAISDIKRAYITLGSDETLDWKDPISGKTLRETVKELENKGIPISISKIAPPVDSIPGPTAEAVSRPADAGNVVPAFMEDAGAALTPPTVKENLTVEPPATPPAEGPEPSLTSARQAMIEIDREKILGQKAPTKEKRGWHEAKATAIQNGIPDKALRIASAINIKPEPIDDITTAGLVVKAEQLKQEHADLMKKIGQSKDDADVMILSSEVNRVQDEFDSLTTAIYKSGSEKGRALAAQKLTINQDYDIVSVVNRARAAKGKKITAQEEAVLTELTKKMQASEERITNLENKIKELEAKRSVKEGVSKRYNRMNNSEKNMELSDLYAKASELFRAGCNPN